MRNEMKKKGIKLIAATVILLITALALTGCGGDNEIKIGSKDFGESIVLGEMFAQLIEANTDLKVTRKLNMGGTFVCFEAIKKGDIDIYPEYTGTGLTAQLKKDVVGDPEEAYRIVSEEFDKQFGITWLEPLGLNNTYTLAVSNEVYEKYGMETYSDLAKVSGELVFGADHEFFNRQDGFEGLVDVYGFQFKGEPKKMDISLKYQAIGNGDMDVTDIFATDGPIRQYNLKVLTDDKSFFPPYYAAPIVRNETLEKHPELKELLNQLGGKIDDDTMTELNYLVDVEGQSVESVAQNFLSEQGLI
jgi:osmoprotectant transport system substrate-binding protein